MQILNYLIMDHIFSVELPFDITISEESQPFLVSEGAKCTERIVFEIEDNLTEQLPIGGYWYGSYYYVDIDGGQAVYYCESKTKKTYLKIVYGEDTETKISSTPSMDYFSYTSTYLLRLLGLERMLVRHDGFMLHASVVQYRDCGILFSGSSGAGKSTQADLWVKYKNAEIINGDRAGIRNKDGVWRAYGLPHAGSSKIYRNESVPIAMIVFLQHGEENVIKKLSVFEALPMVLSQCFIHSWDASFINKAMGIVMRMLQEIPVYVMECRPDQGAVELVYDILKEKELTT